MNFGLKNEDLNEINNLLSRYPEVEKVIVFGSRAMGNYKKGSDVDLAIMGKEITQETLNQINFWLNEESSMPYFFDVIQYEQISNDSLKQHIDESGFVLLPY
ncbi:nucleotidyltransferase domain-containing protein [Alkalibacillus silvisoli]|uniref:Polymerase beta nucleotidyltransferase domain-containing protein n=1 Tax=Alkalibacillus silvisoli TaxID=392823 RepID=A0ABN0ZZ89_9BACI